MDKKRSMEYNSCSCGRIAMQDTPAFDKILEAVDKLSFEDRCDLVEILQNRLLEQKPEQLADDTRAADEEFRAGNCPPASPDDLILDISSGTHEEVY